MPSGSHAYIYQSKHLHLGYIAIYIYIYIFYVYLFICNACSKSVIPRPTEYGGYEYSFVDDPPDRCICKICHHPSRDAYMTGPCCEGQTICKSCLNKWQKIWNRNCPICRKEGGGFNINYPIQREIKNLHIYCTNKKKGCVWQGELNDINNHLGNSNGCQFEQVKCSNECGKMIQRQYLAGHLRSGCPRRKVNCQYCHGTGEHQFIEGQHKEKCPKLPLPCPNKCEVGSVPRENMKAHKSVCQLEMVKCTNKCGKELERRYLVTHMQTECSNRVVECQHCHTQGPHHQITGPLHRNNCPKLPLPCPNKCEVGSVPREDMEVHRKECPLEMIQCEYYSVGCEVKMARKDQEEHNKEKMNIHLRMTTCKLTNTEAQLAASLKQMTNLTAILMSAQLGPNTAASHASIRSVHLDSMAEIFKCGNQTCPVTIKMSEYIKRRDEIQWYSDPFYTHNKGYKMCLFVYAAGNGYSIYSRGTHLSAFLYLMKGPHDDELTWPMTCQFEIKLLNQISDSEHHSVTVTFDNNTPNDYSSRVTEGNRSKHGRGFAQYISNENLIKNDAKCQFLKGGCFFFQVTTRLLYSKL